MPGCQRCARATLLQRTVFGALIAVGLGLLIAHRDALEEVVRRVEGGDPKWLALGVGLELFSFAGYVILTKVVYASRAERLTNAVCVELTLAGVVATRLFSAGGAGGIAFTGWVVRRAGMEVREAARHVAAFLVQLYSFYMLALLVGGVLVATRLFDDAPVALGIVAAILGGLTITAALAAARIPPDLEARVSAYGERPGRLARIAAKLATVPQVAGNSMRLAYAIFRERPAAVLLGISAWWVFDIAVLWAAFEAFGQPPAAMIIVLAYFLGSLGNLLPLPGGVGGTEGGMLGVLVACGVDASLALLAVVTYQVISTYLPALPGLGAYVSLRRRMRDWPDTGGTRRRHAHTLRLPEPLSLGREFVSTLVFPAAAPTPAPRSR